MGDRIVEDGIRQGLEIPNVIDETTIWVEQSITRNVVAQFPNFHSGQR